LKRMSSDPSEGVHSFVLPTAKVQPVFDLPGDVFDPGGNGGVIAARRKVKTKKRGKRAGKVLKAKVRRR